LISKPYRISRKAGFDHFFIVFLLMLIDSQHFPLYVPNVGKRLEAVCLSASGNYVILKDTPAQGDSCMDRARTNREEP